MTFVPPDHPRFLSLMYRERLVEKVKEGVVVLQGLIAHGRGEAFDYILGEQSIPPALEAERVAAAELMLARRPVISVNGNTAALIPRELAELSKLTGAPLEVNLFYRSEERAARIASLLQMHGAEEVLWEPETEIEGLRSERRKVSSRGIAAADVVLVALEDGDRTEALKRLGKRVIAIDLNPFSRTSLTADVTIIDNVVRAVPNIIRFYKEMNEAEAREAVRRFSNEVNLKESIKWIKKWLDQKISELF
ncbi:MAG: phosphopantothenate/pantothenate synthetase [Crenarchaeota archaeon]|nr:phosphopantothenate/pantothenate synthetase [Thermoproteota archaeon]